MVPVLLYRYGILSGACKFPSISVSCKLLILGQRCGSLFPDGGYSDLALAGKERVFTDSAQLRIRSNFLSTISLLTGVACIPVSVSLLIGNPVTGAIVGPGPSFKWVHGAIFCGVRFYFLALDD
jgi:hypothetical protein